MFKVCKKKASTSVSCIRIHDIRASNVIRLFTAPGICLPFLRNLSALQRPNEPLTAALPAEAKLDFQRTYGPYRCSPKYSISIGVNRWSRYGYYWIDGMLY
jgi:hypothetical protein